MSMKLCVVVCHKYTLFFTNENLKLCENKKNNVADKPVPVVTETHVRVFCFVFAEGGQRFSSDVCHRQRDV